MVVGTVVLKDRVIRALIHCRDDCIAAHITVILVTGVPKITVEEEHITRVHFNWYELKHFKCCFKSRLIHDACLVTNSAVLNAPCLVTTPQDAETTILHCAPNVNKSC